MLNVRFTHVQCTRDLPDEEAYYLNVSIRNGRNVLVFPYSCFQMWIVPFQSRRKFFPCTVLSALSGH